MDMSDCLAACERCRRICLETAIHCLAKGGELARRDRVRLLWDCADICGTSAAFMSRGSPHHGETCRACAVLCAACAESCESVDDAILARCAEFCRRCATLCAEMAEHTGAAA